MELSELKSTLWEAAVSQLPEDHHFQVPDGCHGPGTRETRANVGTALQEIERANSDTLHRVFGSAGWGNKEKFTEELLKNMIEGFSVILLSNNAVDTDIFGDACEYLLGKIDGVNHRRHMAGEFCTLAAWCG